MKQNSMTGKNVTVVGGGAAGLSAALNLADAGILVEVLEKAPFMGGHAAGFTCKATETCVKCGACMVEALLEKAGQHRRILLQTGCSLEKVHTDDPMTLETSRAPQFIDPDLCDGCGRCHEACPENAILQGTSSLHIPFYALEPGICLRSGGQDCTACRDACPREAICLDKAVAKEKHRTDALVLATGFKPFDPQDKPYGYGTFPNVVTNLHLEKMLRKTGRLVQPSDGKAPARMAFIQCVGSRDATLGHLWCSRVCCGSALRMARLLKTRQPEIDITVFYIDIQNFGKDFESFYSRARQEIRFQRSIPADIFENEDHTLKVTYVDDLRHAATEESFDMVALSIGMQPNVDALKITPAAGLKMTDDGFLAGPFSGRSTATSGIFSAGSATGPMGIAESIASAGQTATLVKSYLSRNKDS